MNKNDKWEFKPCPFCGSKNIGIKDTILDSIIGKDYPASSLRRIWGYCRQCGAESGKKVGDVVYNEEEIAIGVEMWNKRKEVKKHG